NKKLLKFYFLKNLDILVFKSKTSAMPVISTKLAVSGAVLRQDLPVHFSPRSFRATGITSLATPTAGTTKLYDRRGQKVLLEAWKESGINKCLTRIMPNRWTIRQL